MMEAQSGKRQGGGPPNRRRLNTQGAWGDGGGKGGWKGREGAAEEAAAAGGKDDDEDEKLECEQEDDEGMIVETLQRLKINAIAHNKLFQRLDGLLTNSIVIQRKDKTTSMKQFYVDIEAALKELTAGPALHEIAFVITQGPSVTIVARPLQHWPGYLKTASRQT